MAIPPNAKAIAQPMDPADVLDWSITLTQGAASDTPPPFLLTGEGIDTFTLTLSAEAVAAGLMILSGAYKGKNYPAPTLAGLVLTYWLAVDSSMQGLAAFNGPGSTFAIEFTGNTSNSPPRTKQRTITHTVANQ